MFWWRKQGLESWTRRTETLDPALSLSGDTGHSRWLLRASVFSPVGWARSHGSRNDLEALKRLKGYKAHSEGSVTLLGGGAVGTLCPAPHVTGE